MWRHCDETMVTDGRISLVLKKALAYILPEANYSSYSARNSLHGFTV